jgi:hypothetical protein
MGERISRRGSALLSPERRKQLIARLAQMTDDPRLPPELRKRAERHLRNQKALQKALDWTIN